ncbi:MAG: hypothetical protein LBH16_12355 [Treponema sp.]|nr:hypothetical protein [Treponema sp.]
MDKLKILRRPCLWVLLGSFIFSLAAFIAYYKENELSDEKLFYLLSFIRYSSFLVCICSVFLLITSIIRLIRSPSVLPVLEVVLSIFSAIYGAAIFLFNVIIISITGGNG